MIRGKVVLVPFPFDDLTGTKVRPAVCLTEPIGPFHHGVVAFVSSQIPADQLDTDVLLDPSRPDAAATGLRVASVLRLHRLLTITTRIIRRQLGELAPPLEAEGAGKLRKLFSL